MSGFVTHTEYQKHIRGEWRTIHNLWPHIRKYVPAYGYSRAEIDAMFAGTQGSVAFADADGFIAEDANLFWDNVQKFLGVGVGVPLVRIHIRGAVCLDYTGLHPDTILLVENDDNVALQLQCATNGEAWIVFADDKYNAPAGIIEYDFADDEMTFAVGTDDMVVIEADGANSRIISVHRGIRINSQSYATFIADSHNADAYVELQEDNVLKWTVGFDYSDSLNFQICNDAIGSAIRFEIEFGVAGLINLYQDVGIRNSQDLRFYNNGNYVGFKAPGAPTDVVWPLPTADGGAGEALVTDGGGNLSWAAAGGADEKVAVDDAAVAGYLGAAANDGVLRVDAPLTYADGEDFITVGVDSTAIKLDDLGAPDDNTDLDFSTAKHGLVPKGTDVGHFLKDNGTWAAGGGGGAVIFPDLTDTPANYVGAANKIVRVNAAPDALEFGADIEDLEDVDTIVGQAGKYAKVKAADAGIEWAEVAGDGAVGPVLIFDSKFDDLALGDIDGKGAYDFWGTWVNGSGAGCTAEIVADPGNGRMLRLDDQSAVNACKATLTMTPGLSAEILMGVVEWKVRVSVLAANSRGYFRFLDKDIAATGQGGFFRGDSNDIWYRSSGNNTGQLVVAVVDTWYIVRTFFDRLGNYAVWWVDGAFEQNRIAMDAGDKFDFLELETRDIHSGCVYDIKYVKVWSLHYAT